MSQPAQTVRLWQYGLAGLICGTVTTGVALQADGAGRHLPGLIFGLGMGWLLEMQRDKSESRLKYSIYLAAFIGLSTTSYLMAVEIARRLYDLLPSGLAAERLAICGFVAGLFGAAKLTAVVQLTRLRAMSRWQWAVCPLTGAVFGLLLVPCFQLPDHIGPALLYIPWQTAVAMALMGFGPPTLRQSVMPAKGH